MSRLNQLIEPLLRCPLLPVAVEQLVEAIRTETTRRERSYDEMTPEEKVEFIEGEVVLHSPAKNRELDVTTSILQLLDTFVEVNGLGVVQSEKCLCTFPRNDYEPDIVFFGPDKAAGFAPETMKFPVPDFVVEVLSDSAEGGDRGVKFEDYAANGVGEYWIVDTEAEVVEQYILTGEDYELALKSSSGQISSHVISGFCADIVAFFDVDRNLQALQKLLAQ